MKDDFEFEVRRQGCFLRVVVCGVTVTLKDDRDGIVAAGVWDTGKYVRYARSHMLAEIIHPTVLDEIDRELRARITLPGLQLRVADLRRSSLGYHD